MKLKHIVVQVSVAAVVIAVVATRLVKKLNRVFALFFDGCLRESVNAQIDSILIIFTAVMNFPSTQVKFQINRDVPTSLSA